MPNSSRLAWSNPDDISENLQTNDSDIGEFRGSFGCLPRCSDCGPTARGVFYPQCSKIHNNSVMVTIEQLRFSYPGGNFRLHVPQLNIAAGAHASIIGPSGSGKTTLLNLIAGILVPDSGQMISNGVPLSTLNAADRRTFRLGQVGLVFQDFQLIEYLNVQDNILLPWRLLHGGQPGGSERRRVDELLSRTALPGYSQRSVTRLSQGERQRVAICRALFLSPKLILADEPTGNLDPRTSAVIMDLLLAQAREHSATLVMVTHDHSLLSRFDQVIPFEQFLATEPLPDTAGSSTAGLPTAGTGGVGR